MQIPAVFRPSVSSVAPMHRWPRWVKQLLLTVSVLAVVAAYALLGGGIIAFLALLAKLVG